MKNQVCVRVKSNIDPEIFTGNRELSNIGIIGNNREGLLGMLTGLPPHSAGFIARLEVWHGKERLIDPYP